MIELEQAYDLLVTLCLAYMLHETKKGEAVRNCALRLSKEASPVNKAHLLDVASLNNKEVHVTMSSLMRKGYII